MEYKGLQLDKFQVDAIEAIESNKSVVVSAPTGSGKTLIADYIIDREIKKGIRVIYTAPIKALSNQKYKDFCRDYGEENVGLLTGDTARNPRAKVLVMTTEIYRNMTMVNDPVVQETSYVIFDEIHYINDPERGYVWEESIIFSKPHVRMLCLSATIPNAEEFASWIQAIKEHPVIVVRHDIRAVPLHINFYDTELGVCDLKQLHDVANIPDERHARRGRHKRPRIAPPSHLDLVQDIKHQTPFLYFVFSRMGTQQKAEQLANKKLFKTDPEVIRIINEKLHDAPKELHYLASTKMLRHCLGQGVAFHHAGLLPILKDLVEDLFAKGLINVLYTTETFAVGLNMPAKAVCFESLRKFDGRDFRLVDSKEFFQIAGRAGRRGIDKEGHVYAMINRFEFDYHNIKELTSKDTTPIQSQFKLGVNTVLNMIKRHSKEEIDVLLGKNFHSYQKYGKNFDKIKNHKSHNTFANYLTKLEKMGYLQDGKLTERGEFLTRIYSEELLIGELFTTDFYKELNPHQILSLIACICFEGKRVEFKKTYPSQDVIKLKKLIMASPFLKIQKNFLYLESLTSLVYPLNNGKTLFQLLDNTDLLEGDILRFFRQMLDRLTQIQQATQDRELQAKITYCKEKLDSCIQGIDVIAE